MSREYEIVFDTVRVIVEAHNEDEALDLAENAIADVALSWDSFRVV